MTAPHLEEFLETARYFIGLQESGNNRFTDPRGQELWNLWGGNANGTPWCAIFVSACAQRAGILNVVIAKSSWARGILEDTRDKYGGIWIDGPYLNGGNSVIPQPGDCILFYTGPGRDDRHVGIVESADASTNTVTTIEGNASDACRRKEYKADHSRIYAYVRPDWSRVGDDVNSPTETEAGIVGPLYNSRNDRHDMTLRQVGYLKNYKLSSQSSDIAISVINYTSVLGDLYEMFAPAQVGEPQIDTSNLSGNIKIAMDFFLEQGFNASVASALTGCLQTYSEIDPSYNETIGNVRLHGIASWDPKRFEFVKLQLDRDYATDLSGQLKCFVYDLTTNYSALLISIKLQPLNIDVAARVALRVMQSYNKYFKVSDALVNAKEYAEEIYNSLIITSATIVGDTTEIRDINGNILSAQSCVEVPSSLPQTGIIDDFTSYSSWFGRWGTGRGQKALSETWANQGFPCDAGVALIGGYYCIAVRARFGDVKDIVKVDLEDNISFNAIICDIKGADAAEWGHPYGGKYSLIEWERVKTANGKVITGTSAGDVDHPHDSDWLRSNWGGRFGKKVIRITNYGKYM